MVSKKIFKKNLFVTFITLEKSKAEHNMIERLNIFLFACKMCFQTYNIL